MRRIVFCDGGVSPLSRIHGAAKAQKAKERRFLRNESFMPVASAPQDERDVSRSDWKTASFGRGSQRGCRVSADLPVQIVGGTPSRASGDRLAPSTRRLKRNFENRPFA